MTYYVSSGTLNSTDSLLYCPLIFWCKKYNNDGLGRWLLPVASPEFWKPLFTNQYMMVAILVEEKHDRG